MEKEAANGSIAEAAKIITKAAFSRSRQKKEYIKLYRQAKEKYIIQTIENDASKYLFNKINDDVWKKMMSTFQKSQLQKSAPKRPVLKTSGKKKVSPPADKRDWEPLLTPSNRIFPQVWKNINWDSWGQSSLPGRKQLVKNG
jgi:hypothetical protein